MDVTTAGSVGIDMGVVRGLITALTMAVYAGIFWWAYRRGNRERFERDAWMPFADEGALPGERGRGEEGEEER